MVSSATLEKAFSLGEQLAAELGDPHRADTFSRWVAYYLSEQMLLAKQGSGPEKIAAEKRCFNAIVQLWAHRNSLPDGLRPFRGFEPILRALAALDPNATRSAYFHGIMPDKREPTEVEKIVASVIGIDRVARILMDHLLAEATSKAVSPGTRAMLKKALPSKLKGDLKAAEELIRRLDLLERGGDLAADAAQHRQERIAELDKFVDLAKTVRKILATDPPAKKPTRAPKSGGPRKGD